MSRYDIAVIGYGLIGAAAWRHLAENGVRAAIIGRGEPANLATHQGPFASHYDSGRITRKLDPDPLWALLAERSIERYEALEAASRVSFHHPVGALIAGPDVSDGYVAGVAAVAHQRGLEHRQLRGTELALAGVEFPAGSIGLHEPAPAGFIDPRRMLLAQRTAALAAGGVHIEATALSVSVGDAVEIVTDNGESIAADRVLVATGGFTNHAPLLPAPLPLTPKGRTVVLAEVPDGALAGLPSIILDLVDDPDLHDIYLVPPTVYPDERRYLKIGGDARVFPRLTTPEAAQRWFHAGGSPLEALALARVLLALFPGLKGVRLLPKPCVVTDTPSGYPIVDRIDDRRFAAVGGCGYAGKSADEIGRLAARLVMAGHWDDDLDPQPFGLSDNS